ncbi:MAG: ribosome biogenesis GTPase Der [Acidobacteria bacterium RIFCSPLOWO2_02_FULL_67_36]|nr:MAG: ribosome biogenesis GTPase Der [Acidobacteria bacterium RIFCSPLOWO2_02_FULL_67_36]OFW25088.1 MAG: ribosome biogenesis GTPase Der [Acidobacteria bacterium RIFCSPLOWO2_12_FULL_66_21]
MSLKRASAGPTVVLVGRPNVGKSTLFNRITNSRRSIVTSIAGTTRDVISLPAEWQGTTFTLVDTGGMFGASEDPLHELVVIAGRRALETADVVVFVVDGREGLVPADQEIAAGLRSVAVPVLMAVNKTDDKRARGRSAEFYQLGFEPVVELAAEHGEGVGDLLDEIIQRFPARRGLGESPDRPEQTAVAIVGRPNVGKSSLLNRLLREERSIVSDTPGTTRDTVDAVLKWHHRIFRIVDTAGIRRAGRVARSGQLESLSVILARRAIEQADVAVLIVDSSEGAADQDATIAGEAEKAGCGIIIAANKWDLMKGRGPDFSKEFDDQLRQQMKFLDYAPILHISASTGERTPKLLETIDKVAEARVKRISTGELNRFIQAVTAVHPPASPGKREVRIMYATQKGVAPPTFVLFTNIATEFHFSYQRFLVNRLRESFGFIGTPIRLQVRKRER